ncbi:biotin carboxylase N-terminal domain-containing protein [Litorivicinus lipolyticus]|uniref:ATP-binding protein n=1 Tax=Litorivicinus lipolyticus TaxID=418701 RepID=UPI003B59CAB2
MLETLTTQDRRLAAQPSKWVQQFSVAGFKVLIICRGPIRKEVMDVLSEMGAEYGVLLSEKDSVTYKNALAPELRQIADHNRIHRVPDYTGADKAERDARIAQIIDIAQSNGYDGIFAGYGFMAEEEALVAAIEKSGLTFVGPCSRTVRQAGMKDEAKRTALAAGVSVTPGVDNLTTRTVIALGDMAALAAEHGLSLEGDSPEAQAEGLLNQSYQRGIDLISIDQIADQAQREVQALYAEYPKNRIRIKAIGGGGGKGQRILPSPKDLGGDAQAAAAPTPELVKQVLAEVKATGVGDNKNVLLELNIETTRHQEIQVIGNGDWCLTLGGRDCSAQMHEQKLLEISTTVEMLADAIGAETDDQRLASLKGDLDILQRMEDESTRFGTAVGLDSVSTFECIVDDDRHYFMEMNTRIQVEHRVSELCYGLRFQNPDNEHDAFTINSLVEAMVVLAVHGKQLPKPTRVPRQRASVEVRLNATNDALQPHAGGLIQFWSNNAAGEIRDDQGISLRNPDTGSFVHYALAGAYDSNIALLLTTGPNRADSFAEMAEVLRKTRLEGTDLSTNLAFHYGLVHWFMARDVHAKTTTSFIQPYLTAVGLLAQMAREVDWNYAWARETGHDVELSTLKKTLVVRPLERLMAQPHLLSGWISYADAAFMRDDHDVWQFAQNPIALLNALYHFLNMDPDPKSPAANQIWAQDQAILDQALAFYTDLAGLLDTDDWAETQAILDAACDPRITDWPAVSAAHTDFQLGLDLLRILPVVADQVEFETLCVTEDLNLYIPEFLLDSDTQKRAARELAPPPTQRSDEIVAASGGMFYAQQTPGDPAFVSVGQVVKVGDPLYIVEVMKMFNVIKAEFGCTIDEVLVEGDASVVKKGQPLFKVTPTEQIEVQDPIAAARARQAWTDECLDHLAGDHA